ncbi:MAG: hypothetical protein ACREPV_01350 [Lysobacter sp.]
MIARTWRAIVRALFTLLLSRVAAERAPDFIVGADNPDGAYLLRWYLTRWRHWPAQAEANPTRLNRVKALVSPLLFNVYLHKFLRDDDDRALHDHPWAWCSLLLDGRYIEHTIAAGGIHHRHPRSAGSMKFSTPRRAHRIELLPWPKSVMWPEVVDIGQPCWTLFITGPRMRRWGFHCPDAGWVDFTRFTKPDSTGETGAGCEG